MPLYVITRKSDGVEVYRYRESAPVEWQDWPFATHDHTPVDEPVEPAPAPVTRYGGRRTLQPAELIDLFTSTEMSGVMAVAYGTSAAAAPTKALLLRMQVDPEINLDDPRVDGFLELMITAGVLTAPRKAEILNG